MQHRSTWAGARGVAASRPELTEVLPGTHKQTNQEQRTCWKTPSHRFPYSRPIRHGFSRRFNLSFPAHFDARSKCAENRCFPSRRDRSREPGAGHFLADLRGEPADSFLVCLLMRTRRGVPLVLANPWNGNRLRGRRFERLHPSHSRNDNRERHESKPLRHFSNNLPTAV